MTSREDVLGNFLYRTGRFSTYEAVRVAVDIVREMDHHAAPPPAVAFTTDEGCAWIPIAELRNHSSCFAILFDNDWAWDPVAGWRPHNANAFRIRGATIGPSRGSPTPPPPPIKGYLDDDIPF